MFPQPRLPASQPGFHPPLLPPKQPFRFHPSCILALLPQQDSVWWDYSGYGNHGIPHGATPTTKGPYGFAWEFDGRDDFVDCGTEAILNPIDAITVVCRYYPRNALTGYVQSIIRKEHQYLIQHGHFPIRLRPHIYTTTWRILEADGYITANDLWYHIVCNYEAATGIMNLYRDRILFKTEAFPAEPINQTVNPLYIGTGGPWFERADGLISEVRIYNRVWSPNPADPNYLPEIDPGPPPYDW